MTASPTPLFAEGSGAVPSEEDVARLLFERGRDVHDARTWDEANVEMREWLKGHARAVLALFAPILAEKERVTVKRIALVASEVAAQAGVGASETAGLIVSVLAANPEHTDRFMSEGSELFIDGTMRAENGSLSHMAMNGQVVSPTKLRMMKGQSQ